MLTPLTPIMSTLLAPIMFTPSARLLHKSYTHLINLVSLTGILRRYIILTIKMFARGSTTNRMTQPYYSRDDEAARESFVYRRGGGGCGRGDGTLVVARPCPCSLFEMYWPLWLPIRTGDNASFVSKSVFLDIWKSII